MAKGKKTAEVLTLEEKLEQALVPVEEWPYSIPENWCWVHLPVSFENYTNSKKKVQSQSYLENGKLAVVDQGQELVGGYTDDESMAYSGELPVIIFGDHTRCIKYIDFLFAQGADGVKVLRPKSFYHIKAFYFALHSIDIPNMGYRRHYPLFQQFSIPVPPLPEQQRIVDHIEHLFSKLDEAKEKAQAVVDGFELRKSAILHKAFTGELTARWRKDHGIELGSWETVRLGDLITYIKAGKNWLAEGHPPQNDEFGVVKVSAVTWGEFDELESKTCTDPGQWNEEVQIKTGDFLFSRANTLQLVGNCVIVEAISKRLMLSDKILKLTFCEKIIPRFILYFSKSKRYRVQIEGVSSGNQDGMRNVSQKNLKLLELLQPTIQEQKEIVRILDSFLTKEKQAREAAESVLDQIDTMKKAILARAFRGELGTNDPAEENAVELLKKVL
ncbi:MAG: hypothetical protein HFG75_16965 [Hungatella sp.]|nr:hypothetical protein [Hungatella sp.]